MASEKSRNNLIPLTPEKAREYGRRGGIKSGEARRERKTLKDELLLLLSTGDIQNKIVTALIEQAEKGNTKAFELIRDTAGEKPSDKLEAEVKQDVSINIELSDD